jgi:ceramide glucosyltransferase
VGISILKPLSGLDEGLEANLSSYFEQDYVPFEILFAVRHEADPAVPFVRKLIQRFPNVPARLIITGEPPYPHGKVFSLKCMYDQARYELIAMCDSDVRVGPDFLKTIAADFQNPNLGLVTCPYRAISGNSFWSRLEAIGMNTDFHAGLFTAVLMEGKKFAVGPTIVARRSVLDGIGGIERVKDYISEDYMLGRIASDLGFGVGFSSYVIEHRIGSDSLWNNFAHRMRWARTSRRSRKWGYVGQFFTFPLPVAWLVCLLYPACWPLIFVTAAFRIASAWTVSVRILDARVNWLLLPLQDLLGFAFWIAGFFGRSIIWRGQKYLLNNDGTVVLAS